MNTSENLAAMTKSIYGNGRTEGNNYYLQHNTLSFLGKSNLVVLGEGLYDLGKGQFTSLSVPNLTHAYPVYRNYSDLRFLVGNDRENVKRYDVKDGQTLNFGTDSTVFDRLFFNNKTRNLYACTSNEVYKNSSVVNMDLNYAKTNSIKLATWHKISISDATRTYVFQYDTFEQKELGQLYLLSTGKRISSIPAKPGYRISKALFWQSWQYLFYIETKADGSESKLRMWNTVDGTYRDIGSPGAYNFALNEGHKEIAVAYPDKVVKYSLVDYKKSNKLKINGIKDMGMTTTGFVYFIKEEYADNSKLANDKDLPDLVKVSHRGVKVNDTEKSVGLQDSFNLMKEMFEDVNRTSGIQVISAAAGNSYALESDEWKNGIFTYCLLEAMRENEVRKAQSVPTCDLNKDDFCSVSELRYYVGQRVEELTNGLQKPTSRQGNLEFDFRIW